MLCLVHVALLLLVQSVLGYPRLDLSEGSSCGGGGDYNSFRGVCTRVTRCPSALESIKRTRTHHLLRCGFQGTDEVVCCPDPSLDSEEDDCHDPLADWSSSSTRRTTTTTRRKTTTPSVRPRSPTPFRSGSADSRFPKRKSQQACKELSNEVPLTVSYQILGGEDAQPGEFPHMVALGFDNDDNGIEYLCGGSLISSFYVLTAAHCIISVGRQPPVTVRMGRVNLDENTDFAQSHDYEIVNITVHPNYVRRTKMNDIALIRLHRKVASTENIHPACLYGKNDDPDRVVVTGWGTTSAGGRGSKILQKASLKIVSNSQCNDTYITKVNKNIMNTQICATSDDGTKDACQGDSGGPLQTEQESGGMYSIVGVTSYGIGCGGKSPGVYTRVSSYLDWIESIVWP